LLVKRVASKCTDEPYWIPAHALVHVHRNDIYESTPRGHIG